MNKTWNWHVGILSARIQHLVGSSIGLLNTWHDLATNRAIRILPINQVEKVGGNSKG
jgi:hypothetical protein